MKLSELAKRLGLEIRGDPDVEIKTPAPIDGAGPGAITFLANPKYVARLKQIEPTCVIVAPELASEVRGAALISSNPPADFARVLEIFIPPYRPAPGIAPSAVIDPSAKLGDNGSIGAQCSIGAGVTVGA